MAMGRNRNRHGESERARESERERASEREREREKKERKRERGREGGREGKTERDSECHMPTANHVVGVLSGAHRNQSSLRCTDRKASPFLAQERLRLLDKQTDGQTHR